MKDLFNKVAFAFLGVSVMTQGALASSWDDVVAAAKEEGQVAIYHSQLGADYFEDVVRGFETETGIDVVLLAGRATEVMERVRSEGASGRVAGDVVMSSTAINQLLGEEGFLAEIAEVPNAANLRPEFSVAPMQLPAFSQAYGLLVNTNLVPEADRPTSWNDLLDPKWQGKILSNEVRTVGTGLAVLGPIYELYGEDYVEGLAQQDVTFSRDIRLEERRVAMGEFPILMTEMFGFYKDLEGLPVELILPEPSSPYTPIDMSVIKDASHPNAALLFMNYFLSQEAQTIYAKVGMIPVVEGVIDTLSPEEARLSGVELMGWIGRDQRGPAIAVMKKHFGE
ncbi:Iron-utilization periplasmic protein precursor [Pseudooceanicola marinus]|uniref:Iron-utilization periplasmic protein n=1 Tax=Pseudooceanicola marinus TaxID=396013 RepID=A0A1X7AC25_9RHOB|nr:extracellular solute-binding protein [Pseudooceanicola marinus]PJE25621.1 iron ABC transporter substrate-binding protein [Pseudooceanicola marinus]SLN73892.1 Iron-utilization periplasmic protein precursor [Pseudooceanicola marinus]